MRKTNRLLAVGIIGVAAIAACIGSLHLSTTEQAALSYPSPVNIGTTPIGTPITSGPITIGPATESDVHSIISITESCSAFSLNLPGSFPYHIYCDMGTGTAGETGGEGYGSGACVPRQYTFTATFNPTGPGQQSCVVLINYADGIVLGGGSAGSGVNTTQATLVLQGTGAAPEFALSINPPNGSTLAFGEVPVTLTSSSQRVTITNTGTSALTVAGTNSNGTIFQVSSVNGSTFGSQSLPPMASAGYDVACRPTDNVPYTGTLTFMTSQGNITRTLNMTCTGIESDLTITPSPASFARDTLVGAPPPDITITILNSGSISTNIDSIALETGGAVTLVGTPPAGGVGPGSSMSVMLHYDAAEERAFGLVDRLVVTHTPGGTRNITINAEALVGEIGVTPPLVDFGPVCPGSQRSEGVMVYATGSGPVQLAGVTSPGTPFSTSTAMGRLEPNNGNAIEFTATVSAQAAGEVMDKAVLRTNLPGAAGMHEVPMRALALPAGVSPTPDVVHFGPNRVGELTPAKSVTISNCGSGPLEITGARIDGPAAEDFAIVSPADPAGTVAQMGKLEFLIVMNPQTTGTKIAQLVVTTADGDIVAMLDGNGFGGDTDGDTEMTTYYACSAGGAAGGLPLLFVVLLLGRRRRRR